MTAWVARLRGRQLRFLVGWVVAWAALRLLLPWMLADGPPAEGWPDALRPGDLPALDLPWPMPWSPPAFVPARPWPWHPGAAPGRAAPAAATRPAAGADAPDRWQGSAGTAEFLRLAMTQTRIAHPAGLLRGARFLPAAYHPGDAAPFGPATAPPPARRPASRWTASAYLFGRPGGGRASLAGGGGQLGGSQVAARVAYRLNRTGPTRLALAARAYAPLGGRGAEAAVGVDWHPLPAVPVRITVERRLDLDGQGRHAWSAYAAGGFYLERLHGTVQLDGYAQGGVVGAERRDLFVDGAVRAGRRWRLGGATVTAGAGLWGAAQPDAARLDVGPRLAATLPVDGHVVSVAVEGRFRVAGGARPGDGAALTLGVDL